MTDAWGKGLQLMVPELFTNVGQKNFAPKLITAVEPAKFEATRHKMRQNSHQTGKVPKNSRV